MDASGDPATVTGSAALLTSAAIVCNLRPHLPPKALCALRDSAGAQKLGVRCKSLSSLLHSAAAHRIHRAGLTCQRFVMNVSCTATCGW